MAFRELTMIDAEGAASPSSATVAPDPETGIDRKTAWRYIKAAEKLGLTTANPFHEATVHAVAQQVQGRQKPAPSKPWQP